MMMCPNIHPNSFHGEWFNSPNHSHNRLTSFPYKQIIFGSYNLEARRGDNLTSRKSEINSPFPPVQKAFCHFEEP
jgi:hypothetical protein